MPRKIIIDCDPGHDDAMAILLAHGSAAIELLAITTVAGNQTLDKTSLNARRICTVSGIVNVPVAAGCDRPLVRPLRTATVHGDSGLDGPVFGEPSVPLAKTHAVDLLIELLMSSNGDITLVPTAPLTNIATAVQREPAIVSKVQEVVLMGGSFTRGNLTPAAEFNIGVDPEAAAIVFGAGWPLTMVGLDLTHQALATPAVVERIRRLDTPLAKIVVQLLDFFREAYRVSVGFDSPPVHDPCAVARVIDPRLVECVDGFVTVETRGEWTSGMTVTDFDGSLGRPPNARIATRLDADGFWDLMVGALQAIGSTAIEDRVA
jgi:purine nucleosidase